MKMWRIMFVELHEDDDPKKAAYLWHFVFIPFSNNYTAKFYP